MGCGIRGLSAKNANFSRQLTASSNDNGIGIQDIFFLPVASYLLLAGVVTLRVLSG
jgi:hypothetical protein